MADDSAELPEELTITLRKPVEFGGLTYDKLILREPTAGQMLDWDKLNGHEADVKAVSIVSGVPEQAVHKIGSRDFTAAAKFIARFL